MKTIYNFKGKSYKTVTGLLNAVAKLHPTAYQFFMRGNDLICKLRNTGAEVIYKGHLDKDGSLIIK